MKNLGLVAMHSAPRCLAKTRKGTPCQMPCIKGRKRCRMHNGRAKGIPGNKHALRHGRYSAAHIEAMAAIRAFQRAAMADLTG